MWCTISFSVNEVHLVEKKTKEDERGQDQISKRTLLISDDDDEEEEQKCAHAEAVPKDRTKK